MKFKNPETGQDYDDIREAVWELCDGYEYGGYPDCPLYEVTREVTDTCPVWAQDHPIEAADLLGLEIVQTE